AGKRENRPVGFPGPRASTEKHHACQDEKVSTVSQNEIPVREGGRMSSEGHPQEKPPLRRGHAPAVDCPRTLPRRRHPPD
ncbi:MAG TPA: hypothetical protein VIM36_02340, partial [Gemmatimonadaceae bacterium]